MKYEDACSIEPRLSTVWVVEFETGAKELHVWHRSTKVEDVVSAIKTFHPGEKFTVGMIDVGIFNLHSVQNSYTPDARKINQDMEVVL